MPKLIVRNCWKTLLVAEILHQLICKISRYLQDFIYILLVVGISSINSMTIWRKVWVNFEIRPWNREVMMVYIPGTPNCRFLLDRSMFGYSNHFPRFGIIIQLKAPTIHFNGWTSASRCFCRCDIKHFMTIESHWVTFSLVRGRKMGFRESAWLQKNPSWWTMVIHTGQNVIILVYNGTMYRLWHVFLDSKTYIDERHHL